ncbi:PepSY-associated TM helix domain-containing protein [Pedobacter aquatilis]|uniref:PepSY-associated TM helix domain-containing protein n=1 Tax=Pedobacter aquatilis TaxID=351343 RepID=UPI002930A847|nr:PepSY-associated TM helix domain-containing protein [Pedobacter aquatilis]
MKKKNQKSQLRKLNDWLHLWLGIISGIIVFVVSITGAIYTFQKEIKDAMEPWRFVENQNKSFVPPSIILDSAAKHMPALKPTGLTYSHRKGAAAVGYQGNENGKRSFSVVFLNPYDGSFLKKQTTIGGEEFDFFQFILNGHRAIWLPYAIGRPIVGIATLVFLFLLISGLIMWWPKRWNKHNIDASFKIKWKAKFKRVNYDLHNVMGFYSLILAAIIAITGLVWSFGWFDNALYFVTSGGESKRVEEHPHSKIQSDSVSVNQISALDKAWYLTLKKDSSVQGMYMTPILQDADDPIEIVVYHHQDSYYDHNEYFYDRYTLKPLAQPGSIYKDAKFADQLSSMNYDLHTGAAGGMLGKIIAFIICIISASLPITGFIIWLNKGKKTSSAPSKMA